MNDNTLTSESLKYLRKVKAKRMAYFESEFATVEWDVTSRSAFIQWHKYAQSEQFRLIMDKLIELMQLHGSGQVLADATNQGVIDLADQEWSNNNWYPRAAAVGYHKIAIVLPKSIVTKFSIERVLKKQSQSATEQAYFETLEKARQWLTSVPAASAGGNISKQSPTPPSTPAPVSSLPPIGASTVNKTNTNIADTVIGSDTAPYFESDYLKISWQSARPGYAQMEWKRISSSEEFRVGMRKVAELLTIKQGRGYIGDLQKAGPISLDNQDWVNGEFLTLVPAPFKWIALVTTSSAIMQMVLNRIVRRRDKTSNVEQATFESMAAAEEWLLSKLKD